MLTFATDIDLLHWEPNLLRDASAVAQTLLGGSGTLSGTTFTISAGSLVDAHVSVNHVIAIADPIGGSFPIVSIDSATQLTLSVLYDEPTSPGSGSNLNYWIRTFWPQRKIITELLLDAAGVAPGHVSSICNPDCLRRACALGSLQLIYSALAAAASEPANLLVRADLYERLYRRALRAVAVEIDSDNDGVVNSVRSLSTLMLRRS